ncbi:hypothetical protein AB0C84_35680 [Actinomadura sp. NPDC048955]|uniref:hypothetical protein n=1 Tax=Actinomadura sp. NPDC048955 TaxID=3158228 RepID=UPI0033DB40C7
MAGRTAETAELAPTRTLRGEAAQLAQLLAAFEERTSALTALLHGAVADTAEDAETRADLAEARADEADATARPLRNGTCAKSPSSRPATRVPDYGSPPRPPRAVDEIDPAAGLGWGAAAIVRNQTGRDQHEPTARAQLAEEQARHAATTGRTDAAEAALAETRDQLADAQRQARTAQENAVRNERAAEEATAAAGAAQKDVAQARTDVQAARAAAEAAMIEVRRQLEEARAEARATRTRRRRTCRSLSSRSDPLKHRSASPKTRVPEGAGGLIASVSGWWSGLV